MQFLAPETRVLTRELLWKPLVDLQVGEVLWGFDPEPVRPFSTGRGLYRRGQNRARRTKLTIVHEIQVSCDPAFLLSTESGRAVVASQQQSFLGYSRDSCLRWRTVKSLSRPYNGHAVPSLASWLAPWEPLEDFDAGWLSGMFDGEGHISLKQGSTKSIVLGLSQRKGPVLERAVWLRPDPITTIKALGPPDLFGIKTTIGTFFAEGFAALSGEPAAS